MGNAGLGSEGRVTTSRWSSMGLGATWRTCRPEPIRQVFLVLFSVGIGQVAHRAEPHPRPKVPLQIVRVRLILSGSRRRARYATSEMSSLPFAGSPGDPATQRRGEQEESSSGCLLVLLRRTIRPTPAKLPWRLWEDAGPMTEVSARQCPDPASAVIDHDRWRRQLCAWY